MKIYLLTALVFGLLLLGLNAKADTVKVAIIDTGFSGLYATPRTRKSLCKTGHFDFTTNTPNIGFDEIGHGSFVSNLVIETAKVKRVCLLIYKVNAYVNPRTRNHITKALLRAKNNGAQAVNISMGESNYFHGERAALRILGKAGIKVFVASGNDSADLNRACNIFPACYDDLSGNLLRVGARDRSGLLEAYGNKGLKVQLYEYGSIINIGRGTSFAAPRAAGKYLRETYGKN